jgi:hypothetical protein
MQILELYKEKFNDNFRILVSFLKSADTEDVSAAGKKDGKTEKSQKDS